MDESLVKLDIGPNMVDMMLETIMVLGLTTIIPEVVLVLELAVVVMDLTVLNPIMAGLENLDLQMVWLLSIVHVHVDSCSVCTQLLIA